MTAEATLLNDWKGFESLVKRDMGLLKGEKSGKTRLTKKGQRTGSGTWTTLMG